MKRETRAMTATIPPGAAARRSNYRLQVRLRLESSRDRQLGSPVFGFERGLDQFTRVAFAAPAACGAAGAGPHVFECACAACDRMADVMVGDGLADADVHGGLFEGNTRRAPFERECE